jgi:hypothetical protein
MFAKLWKKAGSRLKKLREIYDELKDIPPDEIQQLSEEAHAKLETECHNLRKILDNQFDQLTSQEHLGNITYCMEYLITLSVKCQLDAQFGMFLVSFGANLATIICGALMVEQYKAKQTVEVNELKRMFES